MVHSFRSVSGLFCNPVQRHDCLIPGSHDEDRTMRMIRPMSVFGAGGTQGDEL
jgi:hypothetical protein